MGGTPRPRATAPVGARPVVRLWSSGLGLLGGQHHGRVDLGLAEPRAPPPCTAAVATVPTGVPPSGAWCGHGHRRHHDAGPRPPATTSGPSGHRPGHAHRTAAPAAGAGSPLCRHGRRPGPGRRPAPARRGLDQGSQPRATEIDGEGQAEGTAHPGHAEHRTVPPGRGTPRRWAGHRTASASGPPRPGSGPRGRPAPGPPPGPEGTARQATAMNAASTAIRTRAPGTVKDRAHNRPGTYRPSPASQPAHSRVRGRSPPEPPPEEPGRGEGQDPPAPRGEGEGESHPGGERGEGDPTPPGTPSPSGARSWRPATAAISGRPARVVGLLGRRVPAGSAGHGRSVPARDGPCRPTGECAGTAPAPAARPLPMQAGMPTPRRAAPATARPGSRPAPPRCGPPGSGGPPRTGGRPRPIGSPGPRGDRPGRRAARPARRGRRPPAPVVHGGVPLVAEPSDRRPDQLVPGRARCGHLRPR